MGLGITIYNALFKRTSTMIFTTVVGAFVIETLLDYGAEGIFNSVNRGFEVFLFFYTFYRYSNESIVFQPWFNNLTQKLWHHIQDNYKLKEEE